MSNVVQFTPVNGACASGNSVGHPSAEELRVTAWANYYRAERADGASPNLAHQRADEHVKHFDKLVESIGYIISEVG